MIKKFYLPSLFPETQNKIQNVYYYKLLPDAPFNMLYFHKNKAFYNG